MKLIRTAAVAAALLATVGMAGCGAQSAAAPEPAASSSAPAAPTPTEVDPTTTPDYTEGYDAGDEAARDDYAGDDTAPAGHSAEWVQGWHAGYDETAKLMDSMAPARAKFLEFVRGNGGKVAGSASDTKLLSYGEQVCEIQAGELDTQAAEAKLKSLGLDRYDVAAVIGASRGICSAYF